MSPLALPTVFRASTIAASGDPWIRDGIHVRVQMWGELGFPLHPFAAWELRSFELEGAELIDDTARSLLPLDLAARGGSVEASVPSSSGPGSSPDWCYLEAGVQGQVRIEVLDRVRGGGSDRILAARSTRDPTNADRIGFGGVGLGRVRLTGDGRVDGVLGLREDWFDVDRIEGDPGSVFGLPIDGSAWYAWPPGRDAMYEAKTRLYLAESLQAWPSEDPDGIPATLDQGHNVARVLDILGPELIEPWLSGTFEDPSTPPRLFLREEQRPAPPGRIQTVRFGATDALLTMAIDPRVALYLGLATTLDEDPSGPVRPRVWAIASRWAVQLERPVLTDRGNRVRIPLRTFLPTGGGSGPTAALDSYFPETARIRTQLAELNQRLPQEDQWSVVTLTTLAVAAVGSPPDPPSPPEPVPGVGAWNPGSGTDSWSQRLSLSSPSPGMVGLARMVPGPPRSLHRRFPETGADSEALAMIGASTPAGSVTLVDDAVPGGAPEAAWRVWMADELGRWGEPGDTPRVAAPGRPTAPPPAPELHVDLAQDDGTAGPRSPGTLTARIDLPTLQSLPPGSSPITGVEVSIDDDPFTAHAVPVGDDPLRVDRVIRDFDVGQVDRVTVRARFVHEGAQRSEEGSASQEVADPRAPRPIPGAPVLLFTGRPDPAGEAQLGLRWPVAEGAAGYHVYLGDERRVAQALGMGVDPAAPRAERAFAIWRRAAELGDKSLFTLLPHEPVSQGGEVRFTAQLPGSLRGLQFIRVVPLNRGRREAAFESCGLVPVAIPDTKRPPPPSLRVDVGQDGGVRVTVTARGLDPAELSARSPTGAAHLPQCRLRRGRVTTERLYVPLVDPHPVDLAPAGSPDTWTATMPGGDPGGLPPFVRHTWLAEIRYPAEAARPGGTLPVLDPLRIRSLWDRLEEDAEGEWSAPSLPASTVIPGPAPDAPAGATAVADPLATVVITVDSPPVAHPQAIRPFRLMAHRVRPGTAMEALAPIEITSAPLVYVDPLSAGSTVPSAYLLYLVDPLGRQGPAIQVAVGS